MSKATTQKEVVLTVLQERGEDGASAIEFLRKFGIYRAAACIHELREEGWSIETTNRPGKTALYVLKGRTAVFSVPVRVGPDPELWDRVFGGGE